MLATTEGNGMDETGERMDETVPNAGPADRGEATPGDPPHQSVSLKKLRANQANARRSTGPTSPAGKGVSRLNRWRHGILAEADILGPKASREDVDAFAARLEELRAYFQPKGGYEEGLVQRLLHTEFQERRVVRHEAAVLEQQQEQARPSYERALVQELERAVAESVEERRAEALRATSVGIQYL